MLMKVFGTPMNADVPPMNAECLSDGFKAAMRSTERELTFTFHIHLESSAFIGGTSAFIGVPRTFASVSP
ncbi:MAG: hypothetical protein NDI88_04630 [Lysobacter sp.]|nr:hypothetical protein [Lysobacter sp.]